MPELGSGSAGPPRPSSDPVPFARSEDVAHRRRVYTIQMSIRMVCFLSIPFLPGWWKMVALVGAVLLPYIAVLMANDATIATSTEEPVTPASHDRLLTAGDDEAPRPGRAIVVDEDGTVHFLDEQDEDADGRTGDVDDEHPGPDEDGR